MNDRHGSNPYENLSRRTSAGGSRNGLIIGGVAIAVVAILVVVAVVLTGGEDGGEAGGQEVAAVEASGESLPELTGEPTDPAVGRTPPTLSGQDFDGGPVTIDPGDGRAKIVAFVAHWCPHCQREVPLIQGWVDAGNLPEDVDLYAVSTDVRSDQNNYPPSAWLEREGWTGDVLLDDPDKTAASGWGLSGYPFLVFLDADGTVAYRASGGVPEAQLTQIVDALSST